MLYDFGEARALRSTSRPHEIDGGGDATTLKAACAQRVSLHDVDDGGRWVDNAHFSGSTLLHDNRGCNGAKTTIGEAFYFKMMVGAALK